MDVPLRKITVVLLALAVGLPVVLYALMNIVGISLADGAFTNFYIGNLAVFGILAYVSHAKPAQVPMHISTQVAATTHGHSSGAPSPMAMAVVGGAVMGFAVGYLTRPVFPVTGGKIPLALLLEPAEPMFQGLKSDFMMHMILTTMIGVIAGVVLVRVLASRKQA